MLRGFYTAASGMLANQRMQETLSNNMSNVNTPGYKADQGTMRAFPELLLEQMGSRSLPGFTSSRNIPVQHPVGSLNTGVYMQEAVPAFTQGDLRETGVGTDLALLQRNVPDESGSVFFDVQNEAGELRYTRNGNFTVDGEGFLTTNQGNYVLDQSGNPIETNGLEFKVSEEGIINVDGQAIPLGLSYSTAPEDMMKEGGDLYRLGEDGTQLIDVRDDNTVEVDVKQNFLESSNVNSARTMTEMMNTYRSFEMNQRVLKAYDQSMQKTVTEIARLR
ncbi:flagellar hook-basal body protein [Halobacillus halophilus]|uniref:flagellar hook-basal body protein n=1 Tax=Halobacillus halophilus TaxID=1570 RepID=UPI001CD2EB68|nr:flagellar hook-basal body protein [Halobacillus halophilus]MCA1010879.1 flagellar hook-basal body protein [Halobacillus halophilus]